MYLTLPGRMHADLKKDCQQFPGFLAAAALTGSHIMYFCMQSRPSELDPAGVYL